MNRIQEKLRRQKTSFHILVQAFQTLMILNRSLLTLKKAVLTLLRLDFPLAIH